MSRTLDDSTAASHPGRVTLAMERLLAMEPQLSGGIGRAVRVLSADRFVAHVREHLHSGDSRAAVVLSVDPLLVSAYSDDFDTSVVLRFKRRWLLDRRVAAGDRLLAVTTFVAAGPLASDLRPGPRALSGWANVAPYVADFLCDDLDRIAERKAAIGEAEWRRAHEAGLAYLRHTDGFVRDGRPSRCLVSALEAQVPGIG